MKQFSIIITLLLSCSALQAAPLTEAKDTLDQYIINNKPVERFDGMQLEGKTIVSYRIVTYKQSPDGILRVHDIHTEDDAPSAQPVYVIDGKLVPKRKFENLSPGRIKSITVAKNGIPEEVKQYPGWENGVILVETREDEGVSKDTNVKIGFGESDSRDVSYSVASVKTNDNEVYTNMYDYLRGKVAGVLVKPDNTIIIRGVTTFNSSTDPLIILDGVEITDLGIVNPRDVYSVDILKDSSASIYGIKGANGVILITTKMGQQAKEQEAAARRQAKQDRKARKSR